MLKVKEKIPQIFTIWSDEIEGRIDPYFYVFKKLEISNLVEIKEVAEVRGGYAFKSGEYQQEHGVPLVRIQNIKNGGIDFSKTVYINEKYLNCLENFLLNDRDILIAMTGATIGKIGRIYQEDLPAFLNQRVGKFVVDVEKINPDYLFYILQFDFFIDQIKRLSLGGAQPNISPNAIGSIKIPLPSLPIQSKIVFLMQKAYNEKREKEAKAKKILDSIDDYVLKELGIKMPEIKKEMVFEVWSDEMENKRIDAGYWQPYLEEVERSINNGKYKTEKFGSISEKIINGLDYRQFSEKGKIYLRVSNIKPHGINLQKVKRIDLENVNKDIKLKKGNLLLTRKGTFGVAQYIEKDNDCLISSEIFKIILKKNINPEFIKIVLNSIIGQMQFDRNKIGAIMGSLSQEAVKKIDIPIPSLSIQKKIAEKTELYYFQARKLKKEAKENLEKVKKEVEEIILA